MATGSGAQFVYAIFSHQRPAQVERLVHRILALSPDATVVLHHDPRQEPMTWTTPPGPRLQLVDPQPMDWGGFTMVAAMIHVLGHLEVRGDYDYCALVSGQDYPVTDLARWEADVAGEGADYLLAPEEVPFVGRRRDLVADEYYVRYAYRWRRLGPIPIALVAAVNRMAGLAGAGPVLVTRPFKGRRKLGIARRTPFTHGWRCFKGSQWMALSRRSVVHILGEMAARPELAEFYRLTLVPDESFLQTILGNDEALRGRAQRLTFTRWARSGAAHPQVLRSADVDDAVASGCAFARKFDTAIDGGALDLIDRAVGGGGDGAP